MSEQQKKLIAKQKKKTTTTIVQVVQCSKMFDLRKLMRTHGYIDTGNEINVGDQQF